jgi:hypothetical protein
LTKNGGTVATISPIMGLAANTRDKPAKMLEYAIIFLIFKKTPIHYSIKIPSGSNPTNLKLVLVD